MEGEGEGEPSRSELNGHEDRAERATTFGVGGLGRSPLPFGSGNRTTKF